MIENSGHIMGLNEPVEHTDTLFINNSVYQQKNTAQMNNLSMESSFVEENSGEKKSGINNQQQALIENEVINNYDNVSEISHENKNEESEITSSSLDIENKFAVENKDISNPLENNENVDEKDITSVDEIDEKATVRKLSLFDTLDETPKEAMHSPSEDISNKTDPILDSEDDSADELPEDIESKEFEPKEELVDEDFNQTQDEELLDIPTFLRRQAN